MIAENKFIHDLEFYLDVEFNPYDKGRIKGMLINYRDSIPAIIIKKDIEVFVPILPPDKICTEENLIQEANDFCERYSISLQDFRCSEKGKVKCIIAEIRKEFCTYIINNYKINQRRLADFLNVERSSISYYTAGKKTKYIRKLPLKKTA
jgi:hypothetical protein